MPTANRHARDQRWIMAGQGASSVGNLALTIVAARALPLPGFSSFVLAFVLQQVLSGFLRAGLFETPLTEGDRDRAVELASRALAIAVALGVCLALVGVALPIEDRALSALLTLQPALLLHDGLRYRAIASGEPGLAARADVAWTVLLLAALGIGTAMTIAWSAAGLVVVWSLTALGSLVVVPGSQWRASGVGAARRWLLAAGGNMVAYGAEFLVSSGALLVAVLLAGLFVDKQLAGTVQAANLIFSPVTVLVLALRTVVLYGLREVDGDASRERRMTVRWAALGAGVTTIVLLAAVWAPVEVLAIVTGDSTVAAIPLLVPVALYRVGEVVSLPPFMALRSGSDGWRLLAVRSVLGSTLIAVGLAATSFGASAFAYALAGVSLVSAGVWWRIFSVRRPQVSSTDGNSIDPVSRQEA